MSAGKKVKFPRQAPAGPPGQERALCLFVWAGIYNKYTTTATIITRINQMTQ